MIVLRMAWRNIWRNGARTAVTGTAVALNTAILILVIGLTDGMMKTTLHNLTSMALGEAEVHAPRYREERRFFNSVHRPERILEAADAAGIPAAARAYGPGLAAVGSKSAGAVYWGVDPKRERRAFELASQVATGTFLPEAPDPNPEAASHRPIVLGAKLANMVQAEVGSELVAVVQAADGSIGNELFAVTGILKRVSSDIDSSAAILRQSDFEELFVSQGRIHEIALNTSGRLTPDQIAAAMRPVAAGEEVLTWRELAPAPAQMIDLFSGFMAVFGLIFGLAAGTGVMNSMLMSTFDRIREFGVIKALGATPVRIVRDVACEALVLGLFFSGIGAGLGASANYLLSVHGINLATGDALALSGVAFDSVWRSTMSVEGVLLSVAVMSAVSVLAALYPAVKAARLDPVIAMTEP